MTTNNPYEGAQPDPQYPTANAHPDAYSGAQNPTAQNPTAQYPTPEYWSAGQYSQAPYGAGQYQYPAAHYADPYAGYYPGGYSPPPAPPVRSPKRGWRLGAGIAAITAAALVGGIAIGDATSGTTGGSGSTAALVPETPDNGSGSGGSNSGGSGSGSSGGGILPGQAGGGTSTSVTLANDAQKTGIVTIVSTLRYQNAQSAGTGMVLTSDGEILTNNHVIDGATSIVVTVVSTGKSYRADVVGTAPTKDVAVLQLRNASGLKTAKIGDSDDVSVGDSVVGVGNAGGTGMLRASSGKVTALDQSITATDGSGSSGEKLSGLIEVNAPIISGDSGGPLYDSAGQIVGMDTAASANTAITRAYAIPIDDAEQLADQIEKGVETSTIHIGLPAFLGVGIANASTDGAVVDTLLEGGPAAAAGITEGSVITAVGNTRIHSGAGLKTALDRYEPGKKAKITWTDAAGASHTATVTLGTGPAD